MSRIRTIKPEFWRHEDLSALPESTHLLAAALLNYADDEGYFNANPKLVQAECSPLREPSVSVHDSLQSLIEIGYLRVGDGSDGKRYGHIVRFESHQRINRKTPSKIKVLRIVWEPSLHPHDLFSEDSHLEQGTGNREGNREQGTGNGAHAPKSAVRDALLTVLDKVHADAVIEHRRVIKWPLSLRAAELLAKKFSAAKNPNAAADTMIERGWRGFDVEWTKGQSPRPHERDETNMRTGGVRIKER